MRKPKLKQITAALRQLTPVERKAVVAELAALDAGTAAVTVIEGRFAAGTVCPHCKAEHARRHGLLRGLQRYFCIEWRRTFTALTGTPLNGLHKRAKWLRHAQVLAGGLKLHDVADELDIHVSTAHRWRHRFLSLPQTLQPQALTGIAEADETVFLLSFKGKRSGLDRKARKRGGKARKPGMSQEQVPVLVARDRAGLTLSRVLTALDMPTLAAALKPFVASDVVLCTDGSKALGAVARALGVEHHGVNLSAGIRVDGPWHVQNVNAYHSRLKHWIGKFHGVATCYLKNYLGWFRAIDGHPRGGPKPAQWLAMALGGAS